MRTLAWIAREIVLQRCRIEHADVDIEQQGIDVVETRLEHQGTAHRGVGRHLDADLHQEAVARGGRKLERLLALDPIAIREDLHVREMVLAVEGGDRALRHEAQQQANAPGGGRG